MTAVLPIIDREDGVQNVETCKACGGKCCQSHAGAAVPADFGPPETLTAVLVEYLKTGYWAVDCWEGDPRPPSRQKPERQSRVYYIRPAHTNAVGQVTDWSYGGTCRLWTAEHGCGLPFKQRPYQCRHLKPQQTPEDDCTGVGKREIGLAWIPFQSQIKEALAIVTGEPDW